MARTVIRHTKFTPNGYVSKVQAGGPVDKYRKLLKRQGVKFTEEVAGLSDDLMETSIRESVRSRSGEFMKWDIIRLVFRFNHIQVKEMVSIFTF